MVFQNRQDAGQRLAEALGAYRGDADVVVIALPRGGVVVGAVVAKRLALPLDIVCPRKVGAPGNEEFAVGAVTETGEVLTSEFTLSDKSIKKEVEIAKQRLTRYRQDRPPRDLKGKRVVIVDDGLATGLTMRAAIKTVQSEGAAEIVVAVPVGPTETVERLKRDVDAVICLLTPPNFLSVGQFYETFEQTSDEEVMALLASTASGQEHKRA